MRWPLFVARDTGWSVEGGWFRPEPDYPWHHQVTLVSRRWGIGRFRVTADAEVRTWTGLHVFAWRTDFFGHLRRLFIDFGRVAIWIDIHWEA